MKKYLFLFLFVFTQLYVAVALPRPYVDSMAKAFNEANMIAVSGYLANNVDITINEEKSIYSKKQARLILERFYRKHKIRAYEVQYVSPHDNSNFLYVIGQLKSFRGNYLLLVNIKQLEDSYEIIGLKIESQT